MRDKRCPSKAAELTQVLGAGNSLLNDTAGDEAKTTERQQADWILVDAKKRFTVIVLTLHQDHNLQSRIEI